MTARIVLLARSGGGVPKQPISSATVSELGLEGDKVNHPKIHGGPERALCLYSLELMEKLQAEGHPIFPGSIGENVLIRGLDWSVLREGTRLRLGDAVSIELTKTATPCKTIAASFSNRRFLRLGVEGEMRWYCRVLRTGSVHVGDLVEITAS
jgi:MOSC domain-containing protein YiiM